ncbi:MAG TPA: hypothetical protein VJS30_15595 [Paraburkholderia sp.]|nr:hypothetical protein [Paraburkholderia sp.]
MGKIAVVFDPDFMLASMDLWRQSVDLEIDMLDEFKVHMMANRKPILENYVRTAGMWMSMLGAMTPADLGAESELMAVRAEVEDFAAWAESELQVLGDLAAE